MVKYLTHTSKKKYIDLFFQNLAVRYLHSLLLSKGHLQIPTPISHMPTLDTLKYVFFFFFFCVCNQWLQNKDKKIIVGRELNNFHATFLWDYTMNVPNWIDKLYYRYALIIPLLNNNNSINKTIHFVDTNSELKGKYDNQFYYKINKPWIPYISVVTAVHDDTGAFVKERVKGCN